MKINLAVKKAIKAYYDGIDPEELMRLTKDGTGYSFTREFFDDLEADMVPDTKKEKAQFKRDATSEGVNFMGDDEALGNEDEGDI